MPTASPLTTRIKLETPHPTLSLRRAGVHPRASTATTPTGERQSAVDTPFTGHATKWRFLSLACIRGHVHCHLALMIPFSGVSVGRQPPHSGARQLVYLFSPGTRRLQENEHEDAQKKKEDDGLARPLVTGPPGLPLPLPLLEDEGRRKASPFLFYSAQS